MRKPSRYCIAALFAASLGGCQALGGGGGVMPESDLGPPPSARGTLPGRPLRSVQTDEDGAALSVAPTRRLELPKNIRGETQTADTGPRRIRREEIDGETTAQSSSGGLSPQMSSGGSVGLGGKF
ncbi:hypothetical protein [Methylorubrum zatmanii]|uniref:Translation initiation factor IF-2 n=1 Tax=Methylorubrum zatmanii TaxID=29429 RepID=A0ABW1WLN2_9HYPH|nr:hypothetical protein [Methylorubrum zatmanii]MBD8907455.1 hypothetical protein [Methylorubrum zatmanii]